MRSPVLLALDAGGSTTRALLINGAGDSLGRFEAGSGNPSAVGVPAALVALKSAVAGVLLAAGRDVHEIRSMVLATAGSDRLIPSGRLVQELGLDPTAHFQRVSDLLAMFYSAAEADEGAALVVGTGSVAGRVRGGELVRVVGGNGWLLGDAGSGFWIGRRVARAVTSELDGTGEPTLMTGALLRAFGLTQEGEQRHGRALVLERIVDVVYAAAPVRLAQLAPICFAAAADGDRCAMEILLCAEHEIANLVQSVAGPGPLVVGGGVWRQGFERIAKMAGPIQAALGARLVVTADDGLLGAVALALRAMGLPANMLSMKLNPSW